MNKISLLLVLMFLAPSALLSQNSDNFTAMIDSNYHYLDKNRITTGALYNRVYPWARLIDYQNSDTIDFKYAKQAWLELYMSKYNKSALPPIEYLYHRVKTNELEAKGISVGYIDFGINFIDSLAVESGALEVNPNDSLLRDGNLSLNPYSYKRISLPIISQSVINEENPYFYFDNELKLTNAVSQGSISEISININGRSINLMPGERKMINMSGIASGKYTATIGLKRSGTWLYIPYLFDIFPTVELMSATVDYCKSLEPIRIWSGSELMFKGYDEAVASQAFGEYKIFYKMTGVSSEDCGTKLITKPLIFIDGFDPGDNRKIDYDFESDGITYKPVWSFLNFGYSQHIGDSLRLKGFDIIVLNFPEYVDPTNPSKIRDGGADYIERNAMVLVKLIQNIKDSLEYNGVPIEERNITIVGPSMGGQISRYALAYMEKQFEISSLEKWKHNVKLWMSFDSPHDGANIPIGLQQFLEFMAYRYNNEGAKNKFENMIMAVAAKQMLIHHMTGLNRTSSFFTTYYNNLNSNGVAGSNGYPMDTRKVTLSSGAGNGEMLASPGASALNIHAKAYDIVNAIDINIRFMPESNVEYKSLEAKAVKTSASGVYYFGLPYSYIGLWNTDYPILNVQRKYRNSEYGIPTWLPFRLKKVYSYMGEYTSKNTLNIGSVDVVQGGYNTALHDVYNELNREMDAYGDMLTDKTWHSQYKKSTFIPTVSSLGFKNTNFNWKTRIDDRDLNCTEEIYFDNYHLPSENNEHVKLDSLSALWAQEEILYGKQDCPNICATEILGYNNYMCEDVTYTYTLNETIPLGSTIVWEYSTGIEVVSGGDGHEYVSIKYNGTPVEYNASKFVRAVIKPTIAGEQCGARKTIEKKIFYGSVDIETVYEFDIYNTLFQVYIMPDIPGNIHEWKATSTSPWETSLGNSKIFTKTHPTSPAEYYSVRVSNPNCTGYIFEHTGRIPYYYPSDTLSSPFSKSIDQNIEFTLMPNPTSDKWNLLIPKDWQDIETVITVIAIDGKELSTKSSINKDQIEINARGLPAGHYFIKITSNLGVHTIKAVKK